MSLTLGQKVKLVRTLGGISQQQLADKIGVERSLLSYFENGKTDFKPERLEQIERALGVSSLNLPIQDLLSQVGPAENLPTAA